MSSSLYGYSDTLYRDHYNDYREGKCLEDPKSTLYGLQSKVDLLPVPSLKESVALYLKSIVPLTSPQELIRTQEVASRFLTGIGPVLQERLLQRAKERKNTSWFAEWWNYYAYLSYRDTVVHYVTYYLQFADESSHAMNQSRRAARLIFHCATYRKQVITASLKPDMRKNGKPRSNTQWKFIFNTCRMPAEDQDFVRTFAGDVYGHIIISCKNRFYSLEVCARDMDPMSIDEIEDSINWIIKYSETIGADHLSPGILTADHRDLWAANYKKLTKEKVNLASVHEIQSSMFMVCLDDTSPVTREEIGELLLHSDGTNRFWDKSFQIVVFNNGKAGYVGEHSMADGLTSTRFVNEMLENLFEDSEELKLASSRRQPKKFPKLLSFILDKPLSEEIGSALSRFKQFIASKELKVLMFHGFGKNRIKTFKCSPDAFAQVAIQVAYYKTFGYCRATYESTQTRDYLHGRTEVTRSCTEDSLRLSRKLVDAYEASTSFEKDSYQHLMKAINGHTKYIRQAAQAKGCDRHLLGLKLSLKHGEDDSFFKDKTYSSSSTWSISTSGLVGEKMDGWGFGEVVTDGIGIGYSVQNNRLRFTVTSGHRSDEWAPRFCANLEWSLLQMSQLCIKYTPSTKSKL